MAKDKKAAGDKIVPAKGKLGIMIPGMGAVATTFVAGVEAVRKGYAKPIGSLTQMGTVRLGKRTEARTPKVNEFVPLADLDNLVLLCHRHHWKVHEGAWQLVMTADGRVVPIAPTITFGRARGPD